jgi:DNA-directed RNA polymerase specialized sigma24 family protein
VRYKFRKSNEDAKDLTQSFFASALEREFFQRFDPALAAFRTYLRMAVERFAASRHAAESRDKRGGGVAFEPLDESHFRRRHLDTHWRSGARLRANSIVSR